MIVHRRRGLLKNRWVWEVRVGHITISPHFHSKQEARDWIEQRLKNLRKKRMG